MVIDMKRLCLYIFFIAVFVGCQQKSEFCEPELSKPAFRAFTEAFSSGFTKTSLGADYSSVWSEGDKIAIFAGSSEMDQYILDQRCTGSSNGIFNLLLQGNGSGVSLPANIAIYPYQENLTCLAESNGYKFTGFSYPSLQNYCIGSFDNGAYAMAAITTADWDYDLKFFNVGGAMKLQLIGNDVVKKITIRGKDGEKLSGRSAIKVYSDGSFPGIEMDEDAEEFVSLVCGEGVQLTTTAVSVFYFALPPTDFAKGFEVEVENAEGKVCVLQTSVRNVVGRSQILAMPIAKVEFGGQDVADGDYIDEYGVNWGQGVVINGLRWAPVNCGYKEPSVDDKGFPFGKMYQWGRKWGVGYNTTYDASVADKAEGGNITVAEANVPANANVFYMMSSGNNQSHWFTDASFDNVWNAGEIISPVKSAYDPCPDGWRMPTQAEMKALVAKKSAFVEVDGQKGYWFSGSTAYAEGVPAIFLPASGDINNKCTAYNRNTYGRYWTSTVKETDNLIYYITFSSSAANVVRGGSVNGYSVRCVAVE